jgi:hypothetical protein
MSGAPRPTYAPAAIALVVVLLAALLPIGIGALVAHAVAARTPPAFSVIHYAPESER